MTHQNRVAEEDEVDRDGESIEEFFGQLWAFPKSELARVPRVGGGRLVWIRSDLVRERRF
jgi:hypothetical protein